MRYVHRGTACWEFLHRNPGRTCWQVGKPLLDIVDVDSSGKVGKGESTLEVNYVQTRKTYNTSIQPPYPMRRRTIPRADTRKRHVYYDWDQRPLSLTSFARTVVSFRLT